MIPFPLTMQILHDNLSKLYKNVILYNETMVVSLEDIRFFSKDLPVLRHYVYLIRSEDLSEVSPLLEGIPFIVSGKTDYSLFPAVCSGIFVEEQTDTLTLLTQIQDIFESYRKWNQALHTALETDNPLDAMVKASRNVFNNPIFVHDTAFNILAFSHHVPGMAVWEKNPQTGQPMLPLGLINDFRVDAEYLHTLISTG